MKEIELYKEHQPLAIIKRRELFKEIKREDLSDIDYQIFKASTKRQIKGTPQEVLVANFSRIFKLIAIDVGYVIPKSETDWQYIQSRILSMLMNYYSYLTLSDVMTAFELLSVGELNDYLPRNSSGNADSGHYQQFNANYFGKVLNAFIKRQNVTFERIYKIAKREEIPIIDPIKEIQITRNKNRAYFLEYKYTGRLRMSLVGERLCFDWLHRCGFADGVKVTEKEEISAYHEYMRRVSIGLINKYTALNVQKKGLKADDLTVIAHNIARLKAIKKAFDYMVKNEIQIDKYINV